MRYDVCLSVVQVLSTVTDRTPQPIIEQIVSAVFRASRMGKIAAVLGTGDSWLHCRIIS